MRIAIVLVLILPLLAIGQSTKPTTQMGDAQRLAIKVRELTEENKSLLSTIEDLKAQLAAANSNLRAATRPSIVAATKPAVLNDIQTAISEKRLVIGMTLDEAKAAMGGFATDAGADGDEQAYLFNRSTYNASSGAGSTTSYYGYFQGDKLVRYELVGQHRDGGGTKSAPAVERRSR